MGNIILSVEKKSLDFIPDIRKVVARKCHIANEKLDWKTRKREIVQARQLAMFFSKQYTTASLATIGEEIGNKDHATVLHACKTVSNLHETDAVYRGLYFSIMEEVDQLAGNFERSEYDMICISCGSKDIQAQAWVDPNTKKYIDEIEQGHKYPQNNWCNTCHSHVQLIIRHEYDQLHAEPKLEPELSEDQKLLNKTIAEVKNEFET